METIQVNGVEVFADNWSSPFRTCYYCGSIHPLDLLDILKSDDHEKVDVIHIGGLSDREVIQPTVSWADFKYGYPHKLYINGIPNPKAARGIQTIVGHECQGSKKTPILGRTSPTTWAKFYTRHYFDEGLAEFEDAKNELVQLIGQLTGLIVAAYIDPEKGPMFAWERAS